MSKSIVLFTLLKRRTSNLFISAVITILQPWLPIAQNMIIDFYCACSSEFYIYILYTYYDVWFATQRRKYATLSYLNCCAICMHPNAVARYSTHHQQRYETSGTFISNAQQTAVAWYKQNSRARKKEKILLLCMNISFMNKFSWRPHLSCARQLITLSSAV